MISKNDLSKKDLEKLGFKYIGYIYLKEKKKGGYYKRLYFEGEKKEAEGVYAILVDNAITYVGETENIIERINNYCIGTGGTAERIHNNIRKEIKNQKRVEIFFLGGSELKKLNLKLSSKSKEFNVPVERKVIERALINVSKPEWNKS